MEKEGGRLAEGAGLPTFNQMMDCRLGNLIVPGKRPAYSSCLLRQRPEFVSTARLLWSANLLLKDHPSILEATAAATKKSAASLIS